MELPAALSTDNPSHAQTIFQAIEASTQSPMEEVRKPAEQLLKACEELPGYTSVLAAIATTHAAPTDARATAVILLKNMVRVRWKSRGGRGTVVNDAEKAALRELLSGGAGMEEPEARVASQLAVLMGKVARVDWPRQWPNLFPNLVASLVSGGPSRRRMALCGTNEVLRELSTKRIGFDKAAFVKTSADLLPVLCQAWDAQWALIEGLLMAVAAGNVPAGDSEAGIKAAEAVSLGTVCIKIMRRLLQFGIPGLEHPSIEPLFSGLLQRMQGVVTALSRHQEEARARQGGARPTEGVDEGSKGYLQREGLVLSELQELAEKMACTAVDAQKDHPIGFRRYLSAYLSFFCEQLSVMARARSTSYRSPNDGTAAAADADGAPRAAGPGRGGGLWRDAPETFGGVVDPQSIGPFCIQCMSFVANVVSCSSYREEVLQKAIAAAAASSSPGGAANAAATGTRPPAVGRLITGKGDAVITPDIAVEISSALGEFFTKERVLALLALVVDGYLPLTADELEDWTDQPEDYYLLQDSIEARESIRVSAQQVYMALLEASSNNVGGVLAEAVANMLSQGVPEQMEACRQSTISPPVLACDALYLCAGLGAYTVKKHFDFSAWFQAFLGPALEALVSTMQTRARDNPVIAASRSPLILLRRLMWLLGCWAEQIPASLRPALVQATANVMKAKEADVVIRLSALNALRSLLALWDLDADHCLSPALGWLVPALYGMFQDVAEMENRQEVLTVMSDLLSRSGSLLVPHCQAAVAGLPGVWEATSSQTPLRCKCLQVMTHVVDALGSDKGPDLDRIALAMVDVATKVGSDEAIYLMETGLELWLALLRHSKDYVEGVHNLFPRIPQMLDTDLDNLKLAMLILEAHVVVGGTVFLQAHGPLVCTCFCRVVGQVKPKGAAFVSRALETLLRKFPVEASTMLADGGVLKQVAEACLAGVSDGGDSAREPDLVIVQHLTVLCRVLLAAPEVLRGVLQHLADSNKPTATPGAGGNIGIVGNGDGSPSANPDWLLAEVVGQMTGLFDSAGFSAAGVWRRRLWAMALLKLLPSANSGVVKNLDQIVNICVDVLTEEKEDGGKRLKEGLEQLSSEEPEENSASLPPNLLQSRLRETLRTDVAVTADLRLLVRASNWQLAVTAGRSIGSRGAEGKVVLIAGLVTSEPCGPGTVNMTVGSPEDADKLSEALACTGGGSFEVAWNGTVRITRSLVVGEGSFLNITGGSGDATVNGGGITRLFNITGAVLHIENVVLSRGATNASGAAILATGGATIVARACAFSTNTAIEGAGGAIYGRNLTSLRISGTSLLSGNAASAAGGAVYTVGCDTTVEGEASFELNSAATFGGAFAAEQSSLTLATDRSEFANNTAVSGDGGAISLDGGGGIVDHGTTALVIGGTTLFAGNTATNSSGGALHVQSSILTIIGNSTFLLNVAGIDGGAVHATQCPEVGVRDDTLFESNTVPGSGGGFYGGSCDKVVLKDAIFRNNHATWGGAMALVSCGEDATVRGFAATTTACTFDGNEASDGGGIYSASGFDLISDSTFANNVAASSGGALAHSSVLLGLSGSTFQNNTAREEGYAVMSLGPLRSIDNLVFDANVRHCAVGTYGYERTEDTGGCRFLSVCARCSTDCKGESSGVIVADPAAVPVCDEVPTGARSAEDGGTTLETLELEAGYYRTSNTSHDVLECFQEVACKGGTDAADDGYCADGYAGASLVVWDLTGVRSHSGERPGRVREGLAIFRNRFVEALPVGSIKILVVIWQIVTQFAQMTGAHYPDTYDTFVKRLHFINLDIGDMLPFSCLMETDFLDRLVWKTVGPLAVLCALCATYSVSRVRHRNASEAVMLTFRRKHASLAIFVLFFVYASVSRDVFLVFSCETLDNGVSYLRADYGIRCSSARRSVFRVYAGLMIVLYPVGIPALFGWWLRSHRRALMSPTRADNEDLEPAKALWESYKGDRWYFIVIEYGRRIALTGLGVFIYPNSAAQVAILLLLAFGFSMLSEVLDPFETSIETWLYRSGSCVVFASVYAALLLKVDVSNENSQSQDAFSAVLILSHVILFITVITQGGFALVQKWRDVRRAEAEEETERAAARAKFREMNIDIESLLRLENEVKSRQEDVTSSVSLEAKVNILKYLQVQTVRQYEHAYDALYYELNNEGGLQCLRNISSIRSEDLVQPKVFGPQEYCEEDRLTEQLKFYLADAELAKKRLDELVTRVAEGLEKCEVHRADVKSLESTRRKASKFCGGDVRKVADMARVTVLCDTPEALEQAYLAIVGLLRGKYEEAGPLYERSLAIYEKVYGPDHPAVATALNNRAALLMKQGEYDEAGALYERSLAIRGKVFGPDHPAVATALNNRAGLLRAQGKYDDAGPLYERSQAIREKVLGRDHPLVAQSLNNRAGLLNKQGKYEEADALYLGAIEIWEAVLGSDHPEVAAGLNNRAGLLESQGKYSEAELLYERCQVIEEKVLGPEHPSLATTLNNRAELLRAQDKYAEAESLYARATEILKKALGPEHPLVATALNNRAGLLRAQGEYDKADRLYQQALTIDEKVLGPDHPDVVADLINRAGLLEGKFSEAEPLYKRAQENFEKSFGGDHPDVATILNNRAALFRAQGKYDEAGPLYERSLAIREKLHGPHHPAVATALNNRAGLLEIQGKLDEAEPLFARAIAIGEKALGPEHPDLAVWLGNRAGLLESQGKYSEAEPLYKRCQAIEEKVLGPEHPRLAITLNNRAVLLYNQV
eukprot:g10853.t1